MKKRTITTWEVTLDDEVEEVQMGLEPKVSQGRTVQLSFEPEDEHAIHQKVVGDKLVLGYVTHDDYPQDPTDEDEYIGSFYSAHRNSGTRSEMQEALGLDSGWEPNLEKVMDKYPEEVTRRYVARCLDKEDIEDLAEKYQDDLCEDESLLQTVTRCLNYDGDNVSRWDYADYEDHMKHVLDEMFADPKYFPGNKDAVVLDCYEHSGVQWSISGGGMQCRWDTAKGGGVWVPSTYHVEELDAAGDKRDEKRTKFCKTALDIYNAYLNGDCWLTVIETFDNETLDSEDYDSCGGYYGRDNAYESVEEDWKMKCAAVLRQYERDVHTQCGKQTEMEI